MPDLFEAIAEAIRAEHQRGRSHVEQATELQIPARTVSAIVLGERNVGVKTLRSVLRARPPWLRQIASPGLLDATVRDTEARPS
jgi:hypothetical protein